MAKSFNGTVVARAPHGELRKGNICTHTSFSKRPFSNDLKETSWSVSVSSPIEMGTRGYEKKAGFRSN